MIDIMNEEKNIMEAATGNKRNQKIDGTVVIASIPRNQFFIGNDHCQDHDLYQASDYQ